MAGIFISYRRSDSDVAAGRLAGDLMEIFGSDAIFRDIDTLQIGEDYTTALDRALDSCAALIAVIGPRWANATDDAGNVRIQAPGDWVRVEIRRALERKIRVIPLLLGTTMPRDSEVPADLKPLLQRQALDISDRVWKQDIELLAQALEKIPGITRRRRIQDGDRSSGSGFMAKHWVQLTLGFGVSALVGLVPYLGRFIPFFTPVLALLPDSVQPIAIPLSAAAMGVVGMVVQWRIIHNQNPGQLTVWFKRTLLGCVVSLVTLAAIEMLGVVRVDVPAVDRTVSFAIGPIDPQKPPCTGLSRADCIKHHLSLEESSVDSYFGEGWANLTKLAIVIVYTGFMSTFGALGVMLAKELRLRFTRD